jgi:hypothetical protein
VFFVDSGKGANAGGNGKDADTPFASLDYAIGQCTASNGDMIVVMPGHAETLTAAIALDIAGITIVGLGNGDNRPSFTLTASAAPAITISADDQKIHNLRFYCATAGTSYLKNLLRVAASDVDVSGCEFKINQVMTHTVRIVSGDKVTIRDSVFINQYWRGRHQGPKLHPEHRRHSGSCQKLPVQRHPRRQSPQVEGVYRGRKTHRLPGCRRLRFRLPWYRNTHTIRSGLRLHGNQVLPWHIPVEQHGGGRYFHSDLSIHA